jgi:hypothetical protein
VSGSIIMKRTFSGSRHTVSDHLTVSLEITRPKPRRINVVGALLFLVEGCGLGQSYLLK